MKPPVKFEIVNRGQLCFVRVRANGYTLFESEMYQTHSSAKRMVHRFIRKLGSDLKPEFNVVNN